MATTLWAIEGFEQMATSAATAINTPIAAKWPLSSLDGNTKTIASRNAGGFGMEMNSFAGHFDIGMSGSDFEIILGFAFKITSTVPTTGYTSIAVMSNGGGTCIGLGMNSSKQLTLVRNGSTIVGNTTWTVVADTWYYIELHGFVDNSTGFGHLYVNETLEVSVTGTDTQPSLVGAAPDRVRWNNLNASGHMCIDDIYVQVGSSLTPYGTCKILGLSPVADGGDTDFTPSTGSDHYATVDEIPPSTSDYNQVASPTTGQRDTFTLATLSDTSTIVGIQHNVGCSISTGSATLKGSTKTSGTYGADGSMSVTSANGNKVLHATSVADPDTSTAWTASSINSSEFGYEVG